MFNTNAEKTFKVKSLETTEMSKAIKEWIDIYQNNPPWLDDDIKSFGFAKKLANETARLTMLAVSVVASGNGERAEYIQKEVDKLIIQLNKEYCEKAAAFGHIIIKPNGNGIDFIMPCDYIPTNVDEEGRVTGAIFIDCYHEGDSKDYYTRFEWHRFEGELYCISNKAFVSNAKGTLGTPCVLNSVEAWKTIRDEECIAGLTSPLFSTFNIPIANNIDMSGGTGVSIYSNAENELKALDIALTRFVNEIYDSEKKIFFGDDMFMGAADGKRANVLSGQGKELLDKTGKKLPRYIHVIPGSEGNEYKEVNPQLNTDERTKGIDYLLNLAGIKCGYSSGQFVLNGHTGQITATQVEADDRETIQLIKQIRDSLKDAIEKFAYAVNAYADLYATTKTAAYELTFDWGDITYNVEEDRMRHWQYVQAGKYPLWRYYVKFEGFSEEEAKELVEEAKSENSQSSSLFGFE